jgi:hypothetical protein
MLTPTVIEIHRYSPHRGAEPAPTPEVPRPDRVAVTATAVPPGSVRR